MFLTTGKLLVLVVLIMIYNAADVRAGITVEQMQKSMVMVRNVCQPKIKISDELADGIREGKLPDDKTVKCYIHCILEMSGMMKKNKINFDASIKQIDMLMPDELKDPYKKALNACKESAVGIKDNCDAATALLKCMFKENDHMMFP